MIHKSYCTVSVQTYLVYSVYVHIGDNTRDNIITVSCFILVYFSSLAIVHTQHMLLSLLILLTASSVRKMRWTETRAIIGTITIPSYTTL